MKAAVKIAGGFLSLAATLFVLAMIFYPADTVQFLRSVGGGQVLQHMVGQWSRAIRDLTGGA